MRRAATLMAACLLGLTAIAGASTYLVKPDGTGDFPTIQAALDAVSEGDSVLLANGVFSGTGNRDLDFGGLAITLRSQGGNADSCIIDCGTTGTHAGFRFHSAEDSLSVVDGLTIRRAQETGILCTASSPTVSNCTVRECGGYPAGGGVSCEQASPQFRCCAFYGNFSQAAGGAIYANESVIVLEDCTFIGNAVWDGNGGGISAHSSGLVLRNCEFSDNVAGAWIAESHGAAVSLWQSGNVAMENCRFHGNECELNGAAVHVRGGTSVSVRIEGCTFVTESTGAADIWAGSVAILGCRFEANEPYGLITWFAPTRVDSCWFSQNDGVALGCGAHSLITRSTFAHNAGDPFEGVLSLRADTRVERCTLSHNTVGGGGVLYVYDPSSAAIVETIIAFTQDGQAMSMEGAEPPEISCSDLFGNTGGDWVGPIAGQLGVDGNFSLDPCFCDAAADDFHLWNYSPCNQAGLCGLIGAWPAGCTEPQAARGSRAPVLAAPVVLRSVPNPFSGATTIDFTLPGCASTEIEVLDITGRLVRVLGAGRLEAGQGQVAWNGGDGAGRYVAPGIYFLRLRLDGRITSTAAVAHVR